MIGGILTVIVPSRRYQLPLTTVAGAVAIALSVAWRALLPETDTRRTVYPVHIGHHP